MDKNNNKMNNKPQKFDFQKQFPDLYRPKSNPALIDVPEMTFILVDGNGAPEGENYQQAISVLYSLCYTIKFSGKAGQAPAGFYEFSVPPLEGLWYDGEGQAASLPREQWRWTSLIRQPDFVTEAVFLWAKEAAARKKPNLPYERARLATYAEGLCVQVLHKGPYADEPATLAAMADFIAESDLQSDLSEARPHHEIYLSDPTKTRPENLKTILRHPIKKR